MEKFLLDAKAYYVVNQSVAKGVNIEVYNGGSTNRKKYFEFDRVLNAFEEKAYRKKADALKYIKENNLTKKDVEIAPYKRQFKDGSEYMVHKETNGYMVVDGHYLYTVYKGMDMFDIFY